MFNDGAEAGEGGVARGGGDGGCAGFEEEAAGGLEGEAGWWCHSADCVVCYLLPLFTSSFVFLWRKTRVKFVD